ncbi:hypothetical protein [Achromobacter sp. AGC25]
MGAVGRAIALPVSRPSAFAQYDLSKRDAASGNSLFSMIQMLAIGLGVTIGGGLVGISAR